MKLSLLHETTTTAAIAAPPNPVSGLPKQHRKGYMGLANGDFPKQKKTLVWQPLKSKKTKHWWDHYADQHAVKHPDERLLPAFRGHGY